MPLSSAMNPAARAGGGVPTCAGDAEKVRQLYSVSSRLRSRIPPVRLTSC
jgi:hypothetical protein